MKPITKKQKTRKAILGAITKLSERGDDITLNRISKIVGCTSQNLRANYFSFIRDNCKDLIYHKGPGSSLVTTTDTLETIKKINPKLSPKAYGIGLKDHNTYRR